GGHLPRTGRIRREVGHPFRQRRTAAAVAAGVSAETFRAIAWKYPQVIPFCRGPGVPFRPCPRSRGAVPGAGLRVSAETALRNCVRAFSVTSRFAAGWAPDLGHALTLIDSEDR